MEREYILKEIYEKTKNILSTKSIECSNYELISYGIQFVVLKENYSSTLRIYMNNKGIINIDYSQIKDNNIANNIKTLLMNNNIVDIKKLNPESIEFGYPIIGTDESGKGDYFGPLVSAGVYVDEISAQKLIRHGIKDSKDLSDNKNLELSKEIEEICSGKFSIIEISPEKYNNLYDKFKNEKKNLNTLLAWSHAKAIEEILARVDCKIAVADQFADEMFIISKLQEKGRNLKLIQMHKAENNIAVAAASILARARFIEKLKRLSREHGIELPKGASSIVSEKARMYIKKYGRNNLNKVAKLHFKITKYL